MKFKLVVEFEIETDCAGYDATRSAQMIGQQAKECAESGAVGAGISSAWTETVKSVRVQVTRRD